LSAPFGENPGIVDQSMQRIAIQPCPNIGDRQRHGAMVGEVNLHMVFRPQVPGATVVVEGLA
jgi:hypothetical protein